MAKIDKHTWWFAEQIKRYGRIPPHLQHATTFTREGRINLEPQGLYFRRHGRSKMLARQGAKWNMPGANGKLPFPDRAKGACIYAQADQYHERRQLKLKHETIIDGLSELGEEVYQKVKKDVLSIEA